MPRRTKIQQERDRVRISDMYLHGQTQVEIAEKIGVTQAVISKALQICRAEWQTIAAMNIEERKAQELAKIDTLELEYWAAWKRSQEDAESNISRLAGESVATPNRIEKTIRTQGQTGDPRFLAGVQWCITKRCEILGVNAPTKIAQTDPTGTKPADNQVIIYLPSNGRERAPVGTEPERPEDE